ncbi:MAG: hypothetical protein ACE15C_16140 [Phycisphaerae bacterium]
MFLKKATLPLIMVFAIGVLAFAQVLVPAPLSGKFLEEMTMWFRVIGGFALFIGAYSLLHMHVTRIRRQVAGWGYSVFVFIGAAGMIFLGLWNNGLGPLADTEGQNTWFDWAYTYVQIPCSATIFSILAFFMASAAFRTFRARNLAAALLLIAAVFVMFGQVPISDYVSQKLFGIPKVFSSVSSTIMNYPNLAAKRGIMLGIALGGLSQSLRILLGIERSYLGAGD